MSLSKKVKNGVKQAVSWIGNFEQTAAELAIEKGYDHVICGHIHQPQKRVVETKDGKVTYLNSGDWIENLTSLEYSNNEWNIYQYDPANFDIKEKFAKKLPPLEVVTNEIDMYITSLIA
jgi:UDP-2,3-diacylglucosamine pyrophosphatase LpxH